LGGDKPVANASQEANTALKQGPIPENWKLKSEHARFQNRQPSAMVADFLKRG
jgi:hypothetical protein